MPRAVGLLCTVTKHRKIGARNPFNTVFCLAVFLLHRSQTLQREVKLTQGVYFAGGSKPYFVLV